jgi:hypothetical protein
MRKKWLAYSTILVAVTVCAMWVETGCRTSTPTLASMIISPTPSCASTSTPALIDDMEDGNNQVLPDECRDGYWYAYNDGSAGGVQKTGSVTVTTGYTFTMGLGGVGFGCTGTSTRAVEVSTNAGFTAYGGGFGCNIYTTSGPFNAASYSYTGIQFCAKNTTGALSPTFMIQEQVPVTMIQATGSGVTVVTFQTTNSMNTSWASISVPFTSVSGPSTFTLNSSYLFGAQWQVNASTATDIWIDNLSFY